ncbi:MAG: hypothetical protein JXQ73_11755 [Phycisphaerae bacterium]|nr:hypothetical protein [Phycisphaerae bacterium]
MSQLSVRIGMILLAVAPFPGLAASAEERAGSGAKLDWMGKVYGDGRHNAFTDLAHWRNDYYVCFRHGASHGSVDGEIRIMRSHDLKTWTPRGRLDTLGDDRDPHFGVTDEALYVYFGVWDLDHRPGANPVDRGSVRSHFALTRDGTTWSKVKAVYEPGFWLWRVRYHDGAFYSLGYTAYRPKPAVREVRLLQSKDGLDWEFVSTVTNKRDSGESDMWFNPDGSMWAVLRTGERPGHGWIHRSDPTRTQWRETDTGQLIHSPAIANWKERFFISGRGRAKDKGYVTKIWELVDDKAVELITLPSGGDTSYPGLLVDPTSLKAGQPPALLVSWYSQHDKESEANHTNATASVYVGRVVVTGE